MPATDNCEVIVIQIWYNLGKNVLENLLKPYKLFKILINFHEWKCASSLSSGNVCSLT